MYSNLRVTLIVNGLLSYNEMVSFWLLKLNEQLGSDWNIFNLGLRLSKSNSSEIFKPFILLKLREPIMVFTPHVPVFFWPNSHNFRDIELKFCMFS